MGPDVSSSGDDAGLGGDRAGLGGDRAGLGGDRAGLGGLSVTVLGNSGSYPGPGSACSGYLLRHQGFNLWLDAGPGTMANLQTHIGLGDVDAIVLSHQHPDHWSDIDGFFVACRYVETRTEVPIYAPAGIRDLMRSGPDTESTLAWHDVTDKSALAVGPFRLTFARTEHPPETLAVRVDVRGSDVALGYSADTGPGWSLEALGPGLDLAICEATFLQDREGSSPHLSARQAGASARAAGVERLLISHIWPIVDPKQSEAEATEAFGAPVECAQINATYQL
ncbi:MAG: MBL fold metallo-hydrolase [Actinomycetota bacterium]|nr:MBL fold metallo-hydrolase [Actinomycetota bacterium]